jgi:hypothetical protein
VVRDARLGRLEDPLDLANLQLFLREEPDGSEAERVRERGEGRGGVQHPALISQNQVSLMYGV